MFFIPSIAWSWPAPSATEPEPARKPAGREHVAIAPRNEPDLIIELARINDSVCGVGANWPYLSEFQRKLRIQGMRLALGALAAAELEQFPGCDQESVGHMRAVLASVLAKGGDNVH